MYCYSYGLLSRLWYWFKAKLSILYICCSFSGFKTKPMQTREPAQINFFRTHETWKYLRRYLSRRYCHLQDPLWVESISTSNNCKQGEWFGFTHLTVQLALESFKCGPFPIASFRNLMKKERESPNIAFRIMSRVQWLWPHMGSENAPESKDETQFYLL